jgi:phosphohistidine phosphatase SixA
VRALLLLRHTSAGDRLESPEVDRRRPLDGIGRADARRLVETLADRPLERIVSSPHRRCVETVRPLAEARALEVELTESLSPDAQVAATLAVLHELPANALVCTHREVIERLFGGSVSCEKGGAWVLEQRGSRWLPAEYLPPPTPPEARRSTALVRVAGSRGRSR